MAATMLHPMRGISITALSNKIYVAGGGFSRTKGSRVASGEVFVLDNARPSAWEAASVPWELMTEQMIVARWGHASAVFRGAVWVAGGLDSGNNLLKDVEYLDGKTRKWVVAASMNRGRFGVHLLLVHDELFAVGGDNECLGVSIERLDAATNKWVFVCEYEGGGARYVCRSRDLG